MQIDPFWTVTLGTLIGGVILAIYRFYKDYISESKKDGESQKMAVVSVILGASGILLFGITSIIGFILGIIVVIRKKNKALGKIGMVVSLLTLMPWLMVIIFGA